MRLIIESSTDPRHNLAREEALLNRAREDIIYLWRNRPSVIVGRNQNTLAEIDEKAAGQAGIVTVRRLTGGGAVFHDLGNVNFSYIFTGGDGEEKRRQGTEMILKQLSALGADCFASGRNDICLRDGQGRLRKVCGTAMTQRGEKGIFHGCVLFDCDLDLMERVLRPPREKLQSKGVASVRARVANLRQQAGSLKHVDADRFFALWADSLRRDHEERGSAFYDAADAAEEETAVRELMEGRYGNPAWNYGRNPACAVENRGRFPAGTVELHMDVEENRVRACSFTGDYADGAAFEVLARRLKGLSCERAVFEKALADFDTAKCFQTEDVNTVIDFLLGRSVNKNGVCDEGRGF